MADANFGVLFKEILIAGGWYLSGDLWNVYIVLRTLELTYVAHEVTL